LTDFRQACKAWQWFDATRMAHTLKGLARTLGMNTLGAVAERMEAAAKEGDMAHVTAIESKLEHELLRVMTGLEQLEDSVPISEQPAAGSLRDFASHQVFLNQFTTLLSLRDTAALSQLETLIRVMQGCDIQQVVLDDISRAVNRFDFGAALKQLQSVRTKFDKSLGANR